jgi:hypothetical protein
MAKKTPAPIVVSIDPTTIRPAMLAAAIQSKSWTPGDKDRKALTDAGYTLGTTAKGALSIRKPSDNPLSPADTVVIVADALTDDSRKADRGYWTITDQHGQSYGPSAIAAMIRGKNRRQIIGQ